MKTRNILILSALGLCLALGMLWLLGGLNTPVAAAPCLQATGACCACNGQCVLGVTEAWCTDVAHGSYQGDGSSGCLFCGIGIDIGACCLPNGSCQEVEEPCCTDFLQGTFKGIDTSCSSVECPAPAVGGMTAPANRMALLLPWVFLTAMVVTGAIVVVLLKLRVA
jgi:hypothetical protein